MKDKLSHVTAVLLLVGILSLSLKLFYVSTLVEEDRYKKISLNQDSREYIHLAENIAHEQRYSQSGAYSRYLSVLRTPGYPLFYAIFEYLGFAPVGVLWAQAAIGACISVAAALLCYLIINNLIACFVVGLLSSLSVIGIFLAGEIMVDLLFAFTFITGFGLLYFGIAHQKNSAIISAGLAFGISSLIKPTTIVWPFYSILIYFLFTKASRLKVKPAMLLLFVCIQVVVIAGWSTRNYYTEKMFTLSSIGTQTLRHYLSVEVAATGKKRNSAANIVREIKDEQKKMRKQTRQALDSGLSPKELYDKQLGESIRILSNNLYLTYLSYKHNVMANISAPNLWILYSRKFPDQTFLQHLMSFLSSFYSYLIRLIYIVMIPFACSLPWVLKKYRSDLLQHHVYVAIALIMTFIYFALISGVTFITGPRIVYPAEFALLLLIILAVDCLVLVYKSESKAYR